MSYKGIEMSDSKAHDEDNLEHENKLMEGVDFMNEALNSSVSIKSGRFHLKHFFLYFRNLTRSWSTASEESQDRQR